jgi:hypothetical protein
MNIFITLSRPPTSLFALSLVNDDLTAIVGVHTTYDEDLYLSIA